MRTRHTSNNGCEGEATTAVCSGGGEGNNCLDYKCPIFSNTPILILQHNTMNMTSKLWAMTFAPLNLTEVCRCMACMLFFFCAKKTPVYNYLFLINKMPRDMLIVLKQIFIYRNLYIAKTSWVFA